MKGFQKKYLFIYYVFRNRNKQDYTRINSTTFTEYVIQKCHLQSLNEGENDNEGFTRKILISKIFSQCRNYLSVSVVTIF